MMHSGGIACSDLMTLLKLSLVEEHLHFSREHLELFTLETFPWMNGGGGGDDDDEDDDGDDNDGDEEGGRRGADVWSHVWPLADDSIPLASLLDVDDGVPTLSRFTISLRI